MKRKRVLYLPKWGWHESLACWEVLVPGAYHKMSLMFLRFTRHKLPRSLTQNTWLKHVRLNIVYFLEYCYATANIRQTVHYIWKASRRHLSLMSSCVSRSHIFKDPLLQIWPFLAWWYCSSCHNPQPRCALDASNGPLKHFWFLKSCLLWAQKIDGDQTIRQSLKETLIWPNYQILTT